MAVKRTKISKKSDEAHAALENWFKTSGVKARLGAEDTATIERALVIIASLPLAIAFSPYGSLVRSKP